MECEDVSDDAWAAHESMRTSLVDRSSPLLQRAQRLCLMLAGTIPSGLPSIVAIRRRLMAEIFGPGHVHEFLNELPFAPPTVEHEFNSITPEAAHVCVGWGDCATTLTPWSCPLLPENYKVVDAVSYIESRVDAEMWLARLAGKKLLCNCRLNASDCWAHILLKEFVERLGNRICATPCASAVALKWSTKARKWNRLKRLPTSRTSSTTGCCMKA